MRSCCFSWGAEEEEFAAGRKGDKSLDQDGCNRLGKYKSNAISLWKNRCMERNTKVTLRRPQRYSLFDGESGKYHSVIYQGPGIPGKPIWATDHGKDMSRSVLSW